MPIIHQNTENLNKLDKTLFECSMVLLLPLAVLIKFVREYLTADEDILCIIFDALSFPLALFTIY
jgi:hypothetical protein